MDTLKNQTFALLANYRLPDVIEMISLIVERNQLSNMASGKARNHEIDELLHHLEIASEAAEKVKCWEIS
jgi:hypothetical protein